MTNRYLNVFLNFRKKPYSKCIADFPQYSPHQEITISIRKFFVIDISQDLHPTFSKDLTNQIVYGILEPLYLALAIIIVKQQLMGGDWETAVLQAATMTGFLFSVIYLEWGKNHSAVNMAAVPQLIGHALFIFIAFVNSSWVFTILVFLASFFKALSIPVMGVVYKQCYPLETRGKIVGFVRQWNVLGSAITAWLVGRWLEYHHVSFQFIYPVFAVVGIAAALWFRTISCPPEETRTERNFRDIPKVLWQDKNFAMFTLLQFIFGSANLAGMAVLYLYINKQLYLGYSAEQAAILTGVIPSLAMLLTFRLWGIIFDRLDIVIFRSITCACMGLGFLFYTISDAGIFLILGASAWAIGKCGGTLAWSLGIFPFAPKDKISSYLGVHTFLTGVRGVVAPFFGVWLLQLNWHPRYLFALCSFVILASSISFKFFVKIPQQQL